MNLRWLIFDYVPPDIKLTSQQRRELRHKAKDAYVPISWKAELLGFLISLPLIVGWIILLLAMATPLLFPVMVAGIWVILTGLRWLFGRRATYAALGQMGYDVCLKCGYWLKGLSDEVKRCPECGWRREGAS